MSDPVILRRDEDGLGRLVLNQPARRNALSLEMWRLIPARLAEAAADSAIRVLVVQGAGGTFAAGADISEFGTVYATREDAAAYAADMAAALDGLAGFAKPTLALIEGACVGAGLGVALACDLRFAAADARLGVTPAKLGLVYPLGDTRRLVQAVGPSHAKDLLFTGRLVDAAEALSMGLLNRVF
ncbi:MAG TPA: enoyl-CoA hydratase-related protein, partial [Azospirillaceae bacterium]|nr:enoyl-CoA hydratase-related protein [Azospirillaceae bacterium]